MASVKATFQGGIHDEKNIPPEMGKAMFLFDNIAFITNAIYGTYPNYKQLIPKGGTKLTTSVEAMRQALKVVMSGEKDIFGYKLILKTKGPMLHLSYKHEETETAAKIPCKGKAYISISGQYLLDLINAVEGEKITLVTHSDSGPVKCISGKTTHLVMPLAMESPVPPPQADPPAAEVNTQETEQEQEPV